MVFGTHFCTGVVLDLFLQDVERAKIAPCCRFSLDIFVKRCTTQRAKQIKRGSVASGRCLDVCQMLLRHLRSPHSSLPVAIRLRSICASSLAADRLPMLKGASGRKKADGFSSRTLSTCPKLIEDCKVGPDWV